MERDKDCGNDKDRDGSYELISLCCDATSMDLIYSRLTKSQLPAIQPLTHKSSTRSLIKFEQYRFIRSWNELD